MAVGKSRRHARRGSGVKGGEAAEGHVGPIVSYQRAAIVQGSVLPCGSGSAPSVVVAEIRPEVRQGLLQADDEDPLPVRVRHTVTAVNLTELGD